MRAIDTNVIARFLLNDDPAQSLVARSILQTNVFIPHTVLIEIVWLLSSRYGLTRDLISIALSELIDIPTVQVDDLSLVKWAIGRYADGADFADMIHLIASREADSFATFDTKLGKKAGRKSPIAIEILG